VKKQEALEVYMDIFSRLRSATLLAGQENELPNFFSERLLAITSSPQYYPNVTEDILKIIDMLSEYDTYAQTGYMDMGVSNVILEAALKQLETKRVASTSRPKEDGA
jgi:hypothetical protein